jgi:hypothetical protein
MSPPRLSIVAGTESGWAMRLERRIRVRFSSGIGDSTRLREAVSAEGRRTPLERYGRPGSCRRAG